MTGKQLTRVLAGPPEHLRELHDRLVAAAGAEGILDLAYRTVDTPLGALLLAATETGLVKVAYAGQDHDMVLESAVPRPNEPCSRWRPPREQAPAQPVGS